MFVYLNLAQGTSSANKWIHRSLICKLYLVLVCPKPIPVLYLYHNHLKSKLKLIDLINTNASTFNVYRRWITCSQKSTRHEAKLNKIHCSNVYVDLLPALNYNVLHKETFHEKKDRILNPQSINNLPQLSIPSLPLALWFSFLPALLWKGKRQKVCHPRNLTNFQRPG